MEAVAEEVAKRRGSSRRKEKRETGGRGERRRKRRAISNRGREEEGADSEQGRVGGVGRESSCARFNPPIAQMFASLASPPDSLEGRINEGDHVPRHGALTHTSAFIHSASSGGRALGHSGTRVNRPLLECLSRANRSNENVNSVWYRAHAENNPVTFVRLDCSGGLGTVSHLCVTFCRGNETRS